jgi:predicted kinase
MSINNPTLLIILGPPGSGKSYFANKFKKKIPYYLSPDIFTEHKKSKNPNEIFDINLIKVWNPSDYYKNLAKSSNLISKIFTRLVEDEKSFIWDTVGTGKTYSKIIQLITQNIYYLKIRVIYTHPIVCYINNLTRKRTLPPKLILDIWLQLYSNSNRDGNSLIDKYSNLPINYKIIINNRYLNEITSFNKYCNQGLESVKQYLYFIKQYFYTDEFYSKVVTLTGKQQDEFNTLTNGLDLRALNVSSLNKVFLKSPDKLLKDIKKRQENYNKTITNIIKQINNPNFMINQSVYLTSLVD